jgi:hypothetical protein
VSPIDIEKLINAEWLFLVKLRRVSIQNKRVAAHFRCLSFITEFVEVSFDAATDFLVLKNVPSAPRDFPGHFSGSREGGPAGFAWFWGPGSSGRVVWGDKTKTRHFSGNLGCVGLQHPQLRHNCATCSYCGCKTRVFSIFAFLADFATYRLVLQKMAIFCVSQNFYIADRAFFDLIFHFGISPPK